MTARVVIREAVPEDAEVMARMLHRLAETLGDGAVFASDAETLRTHGFGPDARFRGLIAEAAGAPVGLVLYFPHFSTTRGMPGAYVLDLWVDPDHRGGGLGERLIARVAEGAARDWGAGYILLTVHRDNPRAASFYDRLGFAEQVNDAPMVLKGAAFAALARKMGAAA